MTQHVTNGLTTLTQSKINVGAGWSRTLALGIETHNNSNSRSSGSTDNFSSIMANFGRINIQTKHIQIHKSSTPNMIKNL